MIEKCKRVLIDAPSIVDYQSFGDPNSDRVILLLHGYAQNSQEIVESFKKLIASNTDAHWLVPNGVYPIPKKRKDYISYRFAWYFYNTVKQEYYIDFNYPSHVLNGFLSKANTRDKSVTIIGYSQGGYLAPFVAQSCPQVQKVIGINCTYRFDMLNDHLDFELNSIHADKDPIVDFDNSKKSYDKARARATGGKFVTAKDSTHDIDQQILNLALDLI